VLLRKGRQRENGRRDEAVVHDRIGALDELRGLERQELRIARAGADQRHAAVRAGALACMKRMTLGATAARAANRDDHVLVRRLPAITHRIPRSPRLPRNRENDRAGSTCKL